LITSKNCITETLLIQRLQSLFVSPAETSKMLHRKCVETN